MNFLFPLFLIAGIAAAIPIIIHLFNFKKYKRLAFSDVRRLQHIKITSKKSRTIQNWWLLLSRILFVVALVLAFAQPYFGSKSTSASLLKVIYIDNSLSMADNAQGQRTLLQLAKDKALQMIAKDGEEQRYIFLNNNNIYASRPIEKASLVDAIQQLSISAKTVGLYQISEAVNSAVSDNNATEAQVFFYSDLQQSTLISDHLVTSKENVKYIVTTLEHKSDANIYIDTAYFTNPVIDTRQENPLVVKVKQSMGKVGNSTQVQVLVNGQVRAAKNINFENDSLWTDSIPLVINTPGWHRIEIAVKDANIKFDDTFRITAKTNATLSVLNLNTGIGSPYLQAALSPINGFQTQQGSWEQFNETSWQDKNLIILQNVNQLSPALATAIKKALEDGLSFFMVPGKISDPVAFSKHLNIIAPINIAALDTAQTQVGAVQTEHALLKDVVASMPANVQLPTVLQHYPISAGIAANQQTILSLKNGRPYLTQFNVGSGSLYLIAGSLEEQSGNFVLSNLFLPILYRMCAVSGSQSIYALDANSTQPIFIKQNSGQRNVLKVRNAKGETIPPQQAYGNGTHLFLGKVISEPGFYTISDDISKEATIVAINSDSEESKLTPLKEAELRSLLAPAKVEWNDAKAVSFGTASSNNYLWRWMAGLALVALLIETYFLFRKKKSTDV
jgi:hypothetical protein